MKTLSKKRSNFATSSKNGDTPQRVSQQGIQNKIDPKKSDVLKSRLLNTGEVISKEVALYVLICCAVIVLYVWTLNLLLIH